MPHDWDAASYDRVSQPQTRWGSTVVSRLELAGDEVVLDAGCGTGKVTEAVLERLPSGLVVALDGSPAMATRAMQRLSGAGGRVRAVVADLQAPLPLAPGSLDAIISTATFHWIPDHDALFRHLAEPLRAGGQLVAQCGGVGNLDSVYAVLERVAPGKSYARTYATPEETRARLERAGFVQVQTWLTPEPTDFPDRQELEAFLTTVVLWPLLAERDPSEHPGFVSRVVDGLPAQALDYVRLNTLARKRR